MNTLSLSYYANIRCYIKSDNHRIKFKNINCHKCKRIIFNWEKVIAKRSTKVHYFHAFCYENLITNHLKVVFKITDECKKENSYIIH